MTNKHRTFGNVKKVYLDLETGQESTERLSKHQTCFDSLSEYRTYKLLSSYFPSERYQILVHPKVMVGGQTWKIDFSINAKEGDYHAKKVLASIVNTLHGTDYASLTTLFVEFKGVQDDNFLRQMRNIAINSPLFSQTILLIADKSTAFGCWDTTRKRFYTHPIIATSLFEDVLKLQEF